MTEKSCAQPAHTPGPWQCLQAGDGPTKFAVADAEGVSILTIVEEEGHDFAAVYRDEDARLIAAAPGLLAVARRARAWIADMMVDELGWPRERVENPPAGSRLHALDEAIAKATGAQA